MNLDSIFKSRDISFASQSYGFSGSHVWMWELDCEESWVLKNWCFWTVVLEKTLESPLDCKEIQLVHRKGNQSWISIGRTDAETPILWPPDVKNWLIWKDSDAGKDWRQEETGMTEDEMVGWHHWLNGHEFEQAPGLGDGQGSLVCFRAWGRKELDSTSVSLSELREMVMDREAWRAAIHGVPKSRTWLSDWTELAWCSSIVSSLSHSIV